MVFHAVHTDIRTALELEELHSVVIPVLAAFIVLNETVVQALVANGGFVIDDGNMEASFASFDAGIKSGYDINWGHVGASPHPSISLLFTSACIIALA